jgi:hypothetical protein
MRTTSEETCTVRTTEALPGSLVTVVRAPVPDCCASAVAADAIAISAPAIVDSSGPLRAGSVGSRWARCAVAPLFVANTAAANVVSQ